MPDVLAVEVSIAVFASTNVDDLLVLSAFFAEPNSEWRTVVGGQFLGIGTLVLVSVLMALVALELPARWFPCLGIVPLALGVRRLWQGWNASSSAATLRISTRTRSSLLTVTAITIAAGGDNLSVYVPLFAKAPQEIPVYAATFAVLTSIWCLFGHALANHRGMSGSLRGLSQAALPIVMVGVGLWILSGLER